MRESPYKHLYPRITTKSNSYTVHWRVQKISNGATSSPSEWNEALGTIQSEYRGATSIERYLDHRDASIPDYAQEIGNGTGPTPINQYYRWRLVQKSQFNP